VADWAFEHTDRVRYGDLDTMRHLNNVAFVQFFESARVAFMHDLFPEHDPTDPAAFPVVLAEVHLAYRAPGYLDDDIRTSVRPADLQRSSFRVEFEMRAGERLLAEGYGVYVGYDYVAERAQPLADEVRGRLEPLL
jgi:acyl-CoA thioester hydrolase